MWEYSGGVTTVLPECWHWLHSAFTCCQLSNGSQHSNISSHSGLNLSCYLHSHAFTLIVLYIWKTFFFAIFHLDKYGCIKDSELKFMKMLIHESDKKSDYPIWSWMLFPCNFQTNIRIKAWVVTYLLWEEK